MSFLFILINYFRKMDFYGVKKKDYHKLRDLFSLKLKAYQIKKLTLILKAQVLLISYCILIEFDQEKHDNIFYIPINFGLRLLSQYVQFTKWMFKTFEHLKKGQFDPKYNKHVIEIINNNHKNTSREWRRI